MLAEEKIKIFEQELAHIKEPVKSVVIDILSNFRYRNTYRPMEYRF